MRWESEFELRELIERHTKELSSKMMSLSDGPPGAFEPPEDVLIATTELDDLKSDFELWFGNAPDVDEPDAGVRAPLKPLPPLNPAAIALPDPREQKS